MEFNGSGAFELVHFAKTSTFVWTTLVAAI